MRIDDLRMAEKKTDNIVPEWYRLDQQRREEAFKQAVSALCDYILLGMNTDALRTPKNLPRGIDNMRELSQYVVTAAVEMAVEITLSDEDPDLN